MLVLASTVTRGRKEPRNARETANTRRIAGQPRSRSLRYMRSRSSPGTGRVQHGCRGRARKGGEGTAVSIGSRAPLAPLYSPPVEGGHPMDARELKGHIVEVPDFPKPGISFKDITPVLPSPAAVRYVIHRMYDEYRESGVDLVLGV